MTTTDTPVPPCANHCLRDGVTTLTIDRSFCFGMGCKGTTQCLNDKCGVLPEQTRVAYDEYESDLCPHGVGGEPDVVSGLGFRAGRDKIAKDARANLTTWQCDFDACGADESSISSEDYSTDRVNISAAPGATGRIGATGAKQAAARVTSARQRP